MAGHDPHHFMNRSYESGYVPKPKVEFPIFSGVNVKGWLHRMEQMLDYYCVNPEQRVRMAAMHLVESPLQWYRWLMRRNKGVPTWAEFETAHGQSLRRRL